MSEKNTFVEIKEGDTSVVFDGKMLTGKYNHKNFFIFSNVHEFNFPLRQISSIRYATESNFTVKMFIIAIVCMFAGIATLGMGVGFVFLAIAWFFFYKIFSKTAGLKIFTSGGDNEFIEISNAHKANAKDLIDIVNAEIAKI